MCTMDLTRFSSVSLLMFLGSFSAAHPQSPAQSKVAEDISETVSPDYASSLNVVYFPQLGYLICIPLREEWKSGDGIIVMEGWTFQVCLVIYAFESPDRLADIFLQFSSE